jgi:histidine triad (HIT) family protein
VGCLFCSIVAGDTPATIVVDDDEVVAFLDIRPLFPGHTLVVPREHHVTLADLPTERLGPFFQRVATMQRVVQQALGAQGAFVAMNNVVSQSVPHLHCHVVPRTKGDGLKGFFWPRTTYRDQAHRDEVGALLAATYQRLAGGS